MGSMAKVLPVPGERRTVVPLGADAMVRAVVGVMLDL